MIATKNPYIESAYQQLQIISQDKEKRLEYEAREKAIRDYNQSMKEAREIGWEKGRETGREEGKEQINRLNALLIQDERYSDLQKSVKDINFQCQLMEEYGIL